MDQKGHRPFVHLHLHSQFSLLDGAIKIPDLLQRCRELEMPAVAVTDHGVMFGVVQLMRLAPDYGVKPIIGCELYVAQGKYTEKTGDNGKPNHLTVLVKNEQGYLNLIKLVTESFLNGFYRKPRVDIDLLRQHADGLICLSGCLNGPVASCFNLGRDADAESAALELREVFGAGNFFLEVQDHGLPEQKEAKPGIAALSRKLGIPMVATNDCHYVYSDDAEAHDMLLCIGTGKVVSEQNRLRYNSDQYYVKSGDEMAAVFAPEFEEALENTLRIAEMCEFRVEFGKHYFPEYQVPAGQTLDSYFAETARAGLERALPEIHKSQAETGRSAEEYRQRLEYEIGVIQRMGFSGYFLIVGDFIGFAKKSGIPVGPGRGSGAGSLVAYAMGITGMDPIRFNLLFERFLNPERVSLPDFDIDFCMRRRGEVIEYVREKYGWKNVSQIITFGTMAARNAIRDVGRVMEMPYAEVDRIAKLVPGELGITLDRALEDSPQIAELYNESGQVKRLIDIARRLEGLTRHASTHAAGVVIAPKPLLNYCPLYKSSKDEITTQYDMNDVEAIGLIKMDFLGLRTLTVIQDTVEAVQRDTGEPIDLDDVDLDDPEVYKLLAGGRTCGIFQFESSGMRDLLRRYKPERLEDLSALNALYRPGPLKGGLVDDFIERKHGRKKVEYLLPELEEITKETYGIILYQEQVMQIASRLAGFSLGEADLLRRAMGKKKADLMEQQRERFVGGAVERKKKKSDAEKVFKLMETFAGYGFNKAHSTAYGYIAYQTSYLKAHYPQYFMAALMSSEMENSDRIKRYLAECREIEIEVLLPDVNESQADFIVQNRGIRFGLGAVKNVGRGAIQKIVEARRDGGVFSSLFDFCERVDLRALNKRVVESLIKAGALDSTKAGRSRMIAALDRAFEWGQKALQDRQSGQVSLFGAPQLRSEESLPDVEEWSEKARLGFEKEALGFYISGHPLQQYRRELASAAAKRVEELGHNLPQEVAVGGIVSGLRRMRTRNGKAMAVFQLEDDTGSAETVVFPDLFNEVSQLLENDEAVFVRGRAEADADNVRLVASRILHMAQLSALEVKALVVSLDLESVDEAMVEEILGLVKQNKGDTPLIFSFRAAGEAAGEWSAHPSCRVADNAGLRARLLDLAGESNVSIATRTNGEL